jgi:hypothetical protein
VPKHAGLQLCKRMLKRLIDCRLLVSQQISRGRVEELPAQLIQPCLEAG